MEDQISALAGQVIEDTKPPEGIFLDFMARSKPWVLLGLGLLQHSRRNLRAIAVLEEAGMSDVASPLARTILENAVTGMWLLDEPDKRMPKFMGDQRRHIEESVNEGHLPEEFLSAFDSLMDAWVGDHKNRRLPKFRKRMRPATRTGYVVYRELSTRAHASFLSSSLQFALSADDTIEISDESVKDESNLLFGALMTVSLAIQVYEPFSEEVATDFKTLAVCLMRAGEMLIPEGFGEDDSAADTDDETSRG